MLSKSLIMNKLKQNSPLPRPSQEHKVKAEQEDSELFHNLVQDRIVKSYAVNFEDLDDDEFQTAENTH